MQELERSDFTVTMRQVIENAPAFHVEYLHLTYAVSNSQILLSGFIASGSGNSLLHANLIGECG